MIGWQDSLGMSVGDGGVYWTEDEPDKKNLGQSIYNGMVVICVTLIINISDIVWIVQKCVCEVSTIFVTDN